MCPRLTRTPMFTEVQIDEAFDEANPKESLIEMMIVAESKFWLLEILLQR
jgi:hypothetical protein